jgi:hypothetical protein
MTLGEAWSDETRTRDLQLRLDPGGGEPALRTGCRYRNPWILRSCPYRARAYGRPWVVAVTHGQTGDPS